MIGVSVIFGRYLDVQLPWDGPVGPCTSASKFDITSEHFGK